MTTTADTVRLPSQREEAWKYTPVEEIAAALTTAVSAPDACVGRLELDELAGDLGCPRLVFVNGIWARELSDDTEPAGIRIGRTTDAATTIAADGADVLTPVHVVHVAAPGEVRSVSHPRTVIDLAPDSRAWIIETYCGRPGPAFTDAATTIRVGSRAHLDHVRVQSEPAETIHVGRTLVEQGDASRTHLTSVTVGADIARHQIDVCLVGPDARAHLDGLYLPSRRQRHDTVVRVDHASSRGTSTQRFRGVVDDHARGSFSGHVVVRADTVGNDARQTNRNLLLSPAAEADSRPWLEIFADDVRCTHGATVGRLDDDALFYLRSRGIPIDKSRELLVAGFIAEIVDTILPLTLREWVTGMVSRRSLAAPR